MKESIFYIFCILNPELNLHVHATIALLGPLGGSGRFRVDKTIVGSEGCVFKPRKNHQTWGQLHSCSCLLSPLKGSGR